MQEREVFRCPRASLLQDLLLYEVASSLFQCYKSSKDHSPQLDVNLLGSSVVHKEKQVRKKEHKLKIMPMNADVIVLGLQSKDQAEQWLRVSGMGQTVRGQATSSSAQGKGSGALPPSLF